MLTLSADEIASLTGYRRPSAQLAELRRLGFHRARRGPTGAVILERAHYEAVCRGHDTSPDSRPRPQVRIVQIDRTNPAKRPEVRALIRAKALARVKAEPPEERAARLEWQAEGRRSLVNHHANKRRAARLQRTPPWANLDAIQAIYAEAVRRTLDTGVPHHVDHVVPLQGRNVCGLHVETNLRVVTAAENIRKSNHFDIHADA